MAHEHQVANAEAARAHAPGRRSPFQARQAPSYLAWMRSAAAHLRYPYQDKSIAGSPISLMRGHIQEAFSDAATPQLSLQLCIGGEYELTADLGAGRFRSRRRAGDLLIGPPNQETMLSGGTRNGISLLTVAIDWSAVETLLDGGSKTGLDEFARLRVGLWRDTALNSLIANIWSRSDEPGPAHLESIVCELMSHVLRLSGTRQRLHPGGLAPWQLKRVMAALRERLTDDIRLSELSALVGLSPFHFTRAFRTSVGHPPHQALVHMRVERALDLLRTTKSSILEIALEVGYSSGQAFARAFKRVQGVSPENYRAAVRS